MNNTFKKYLIKFIEIILVVIIVSVSFLTCKHLFDLYFNFELEDQNILILKKTKKQIIIPYVYEYKSSTGFYDYEKEENGEIKVIEKLTQKIGKEYGEGMKKKDHIFDTFYVKKSKKRYEVNLSELGKYDFTKLLDSFSSAPYYDTKNNTLYVFSHSSGKLVNPGTNYLDLEVGDKIEFMDYDGDVSQDYIIESKSIAGKKDFNENIFLSIKDRIVLVTCYPLKSNAKRLYLLLKKV